VGRWVTRVYTPAQGPNAGVEQRRLEVVIEEIGPSLAFATAAVTRNPRTDRAEQEGSQDGADVEPAGEPAIT
jgi:hypothetical protein